MSDVGTKNGPEQDADEGEIVDQGSSSAACSSSSNEDEQRLPLDGEGEAFDYLRSVAEEAKALKNRKTTHDVRQMIEEEEKAYSQKRRHASLMSNATKIPKVDHLLVENYLAYDEAQISKWVNEFQKLQEKCSKSQYIDMDAEDIVDEEDTPAILVSLLKSKNPLKFYSSRQNEDLLENLGKLNQLEIPKVLTKIVQNFNFAELENDSFMLIWTLFACIREPYSAASLQQLRRIVEKLSSSFEDVQEAAKENIVKLYGVAIEVFKQDDLLTSKTMIKIK